MPGFYQREPIRWTFSRRLHGQRVVWTLLTLSADTMTGKGPSFVKGSTLPLASGGNVRVVFKYQSDILLLYYELTTLTGPHGLDGINL